MKLKIIIGLIFFIGLSSCRQELLSPIPETLISDATAFQTPERAQQTVNGMYAAVKSGQFYGGRYLVYGDIRGEEFANRTQNGVTGLQTYNYTVTSGLNEVANLWNTAYAAINRINVVIAGLQTAPLSDAIKTQYTAEARFLRGLVYHSLVVIYARPFFDGNGDKPGLILYTEPQLSGGGNNKPRSTVAETYTQILADLNFAEQNLPLTNGTGSNVTRAHRNAAIALKTRVYLNMRRYADVITEANKIVSTAAPFTATTGVNHALAPNITSVFGAGGNTTENIFSFPFTANDLPGTQNSLNQYYSPSPGGNGDYSLNTATGIVANTNWTATDARRSFNQVTGNQTWLRKWTANTDNVPVIRYAEVLLNLAEALARTSTTVDARALALVNAVRKRSDPNTTIVATTQQQLIDAILLERRIELLGEGFRSMDLLRLGLPLPAKPDVNTTVGPSDPQYIWAIPNGELLVNKAVVQNPGY
jgi:hypothetical protein